jgi:hypothetical protein
MDTAEPGCRKKTMGPNSLETIPVICIGKFANVDASANQRYRNANFFQWGDADEDIL